MFNNENFFSAATTNPEASGTYGTLYINSFLKVALDLQSRIRKPSKRKEGVDPLLPITPARPPRTIPVPVAPVSFSSRRIQGSQNRAAATIPVSRHRQTASWSPPSQSISTTISDAATSPITTKVCPHVIQQQFRYRRRSEEGIRKARLTFSVWFSITIWFIWFSVTSCRAS